MLRKLRVIQILMAAALLSAFTKPQLGDLVELQNFVNARTEAKFRSVDENRAYMLQKGTKAVVQQVKHFSGTGNYGLQVKLINADGVSADQEKTLWVYYNVNNPTMKLYSGVEKEGLLEKWENDPKVKALEVKDPKKASHVVTTRPTKAIPSSPVATETKQTPPARPKDLKGTDREVAKDAIRNVEGFNQAARQALTPDPECRDCKKRPAQYAQCTRANSYLENQIDQLRGNKVVELANAPARFEKLESCVRESMNITKGQSLMCGNNGETLGSAPTNACVSPRLVRLVQNGFSLTMDCLSPYINNKPGNLYVQKATIRNTIAVINLESGFHMNAKNGGSSATGLGQIMNGTVSNLNRRYWNEMQNYMAQSTNPSCKQLLQMNLKPASGAGGRECDRAGLKNGNPVTNMLYTIAHTKAVRVEVESVLKKLMNAKGLTLNAELYEKLVGSLTNWAHNTGGLGVTAPLRSLLASSRGTEALRNANVDQFLQLMKNEVAGWHASKGNGSRRVKEASGFLDLVDWKMKKLESRVGRTCTPY